MKVQALGALTLLVSTVAAIPGWPFCTEYVWDPPKCPKCPMDKHEYWSRDIIDSVDGAEARDVSDVTEVEARGWGRKCPKKCPKEWLQCAEWETKKPEHSDYKPYELNINDEVHCPKDYHYNVEIKIAKCEVTKDSKKCLFVYYASKDGKRGLIEQSNLGIYLKQMDLWNPFAFNYNQFCFGDHCKVPTEKLPGDELCGKEIWLAVGNDKCYDGYRHGEPDWRKSTKYIKVRINCPDHEKPKVCKKWCCCPHY